MKTENTKEARNISPKLNRYDSDQLLESKGFKYTSEELATQNILGTNITDKGAKKREEKLAINTVDELAGNFLKDSVGIYIKQKSNEHSGSSSKEAMGWVKEDLENLLEGLANYATGPQKDQIKAASDVLKNNLDTYGPFKQQMQHYHA